MTVKELIEQLKAAKNPDAEILVSVYEDNDSGEQDHFAIDRAVEYPDGSWQLKTANINATVNKGLN